MLPGVRRDLLEALLDHVQAGGAERHAGALLQPPGAGLRGPGGGRRGRGLSGVPGAECCYLHSITSDILFPGDGLHDALRGDEPGQVRGGHGV